MFVLFCFVLFCFVLFCLTNRIYFEHEFAAKQAIQFVPDFVLFSAFVGNDFVRPLPNLTIAGGSLDLLFEIYKRMGPSFSLVKSGHVYISPLLFFFLFANHVFILGTAEEFGFVHGGDGDV